MARSEPDAKRMIYRHALPVRILHWINFGCLVVLLMSGLQIFNAHPALYWGETSHFDTPLASLEEGVPGWLTVPGNQWLAMGRRWHFFFGWLFVLNGAVYVAYSAAGAHLRRDLLPTRRDWRGIGRSILDHLLLRRPPGEEARYNVLQKLAYLFVLFVLAPLIVLMGLCMSPRMDAVLGPVLELVGGRQSARTIHFLAAMAFVVFFAVHVFEVLLTGVVNNMRAMITGRYRAARDTESDAR